jgi:outer membrane protein assembly factor BamA
MPRALRRVARADRLAVLLAIALGLALSFTAGRGLASSSPDASVPGYVLHAEIPDSLLHLEIAGPDSARLWERVELESLAGRLRERLAGEGRYGATLRLTLVPGVGSSPGTASLELVVAAGAAPAATPGTPHGPAFPPRAVLVLSPAGGAGLPGADRSFLRGSRGLTTPGAIAGGLAAIRDDAVAGGHYAAEVSIDSIVPSGDEIWIHLHCVPGPAVTIEALDIPGATVTKPRYAATLAGIKIGARVTPALLADARERLLASDLFVSVGEPRVLPGSDPGKARVSIPLEEFDSNRFDGALGLASGGGLTGVADLALGNIAGSGRSAGARWAGLGDGRSTYALQYREPALLRKPVDLSLALDADVADSLYTQTHWSAALGGSPVRRARATLGFGKESTVYSGLGRGSSDTWSFDAKLDMQGLTPRLNPTGGVSAAFEGEGGSRIDRYPGLPESKRGLLRGAMDLAAAVPLGGPRVFAVHAHGERVSLGSGDFPVEELRYLGGSEGLRGHRDRAYAGNRILAINLEQRWLTDPRGGRAFLFFDAGYHSLDASLGTGSATGASAPASLARTELSTGWEMGYGAGIQTHMASGLAALTLGFRPGATPREATIHLRYTSSW